MSKVTEVSVKYARLTNLGNYSNMGLESTVTASVEPEEDAEQILHDLFHMARVAVATQVKEIMDGKKSG